MSALITSLQHALATAGSDTVKVAKFVETSVLPVLKTAQAQRIHHRVGDGSHQSPGCQYRASRIRGPWRGHQRPGRYRRRGWREWPQLSLGAQLVADIKAIAACC